MPLFLPRPEPIDLSTHCNGAFINAHMAREKWLAIIDAGGFDKDTFDKYYALWKTIAESAFSDPWEMDENTPFGFAWSDVAFKNRIMYVQCAHFETLNLLLVRAVRLLASEPDDVRAADEIETIADEALVILSQWRNLPNKLSEVFAACARDFWAIMIQTATATRLFRKVKNSHTLTLELFHCIRDAPKPVFSARHPALADLLQIRDHRYTLARINILGKSAELLSQRTATIGMALLTTQERTALAKLAYQTPEEQEPKPVTKSWFGRATPTPAPESNHPILRECAEVEERLLFLAEKLRLTPRIEEFSWTSLSDSVESLLKT